MTRGDWSFLIVAAAIAVVLLGLIIFVPDAFWGAGL